MKMITAEQLDLLRQIAADPHGKIRQRARPSADVKALADANFLSHVMTLLHTKKNLGGVSIWCITPDGRRYANSRV